MNDITDDDDGMDGDGLNISVEFGSTMIRNIHWWNQHDTRTTSGA